jgi:hypothetical protein
MSYYTDVIGRLREMRIKPRDTEDGFNHERVGFALQGAGQAKQALTPTAAPGYSR